MQVKGHWEQFSEQADLREVLAEVSAEHKTWQCSRQCFRHISAEDKNLRKHTSFLWIFPDLELKACLIWATSGLCPQPSFYVARLALSGPLVSAS